MSTPAQRAVCPDRNSPTNHHALKRYTPALTLHMICPCMSSIPFFTHPPPRRLFHFSRLNQEGPRRTCGTRKSRRFNLPDRADARSEMPEENDRNDLPSLSSHHLLSAPPVRSGIMYIPADARRALGGSGSGQSEHLGSLTREHSPQPASLICCFFFLCSLCFALSLSATFLDTPPAHMPNWFSWCASTQCKSREAFSSLLWSVAPIWLI